MNMKCAKIVLLALLAALLLPSLAMAQTGTRATFYVTKDFADNNPVDEIEVTIDCTSGVILDQDKVLGHNDFVEFVVIEYTLGELNCSITETTGVNGYTASYAATNTNTPDECTWVGISDSSFAADCDITNEPDAVEIEVTKTWNVVGDNNAVDLGYRLDATCDNVYDPEEESAVNNVDIGYDTGEGPGSDVHSFFVRPAYPGSSCEVDETVYDSSIEVDNGCGNVTVSAGVDGSCEIVNTVFFEGIPTLSQYGMAIMALLMLGVGFVGFRRFV